MIYIGIDPGLSGAWGLVDHDSKFVACGELPTKDKRVLTKELRTMLSQAIDGEDVGGICVEMVHAMPGQGVTSMFNFGRATGAVEAVMESYTAPYHLVTPQAWKKAFGLIGQEKDCSRQMAAVIWPTAKLNLKKHHGRADALLLAKYAQEMAA